MIRFYDLFITGGVFSSLIASILLFFRGQGHRHANRLLGLVLFATSWYGGLYLLIITGWISEMPHLYRIGSPLYYLIPPGFYLYVRSVMKDEACFRKYDWLHAIPAVLNMIDLIPFYLADTAVKQEVVNQVSANFNMSYQKGSGFIPAFWHFQLRWSQGVIYLICTWALIFRKSDPHWLDRSSAFRQIGLWVLAFTTFLTLIYAGMAAMGIQALGANNDISLLKTGSSAMLVQSLGFFCMSIYLFFRPEILYGIPRHSTIADLKDKKTGVIQEHKPRKPDDAYDEGDCVLNEEWVRTYIERLEEALAHGELFRKHGISVSELAALLKLSPRNLSYAINQNYQQRFTDLINQYRINYIKRRLDKSSWQELTLEGLAFEAGFSSRSAFFTAFKKFTGQNPTEYLSAKKGLFNPDP